MFIMKLFYLNFTFSRIIEMKKEKELIITKINNSLKDHVKTIKESKESVEVFKFYLLTVKVISLSFLFKCK